MGCAVMLLDQVTNMTWLASPIGKFQMMFLSRSKIVLITLLIKTHGLKWSKNCFGDLGKMASFSYDYSRKRTAK